MTCMIVRRSVLRVSSTSIKIFSHYFIFMIKKYWRRRALIARHISFSETALYPWSELAIEAFLAFKIVPFSATRFTGVWLPCILFLFHPKRVCHEVRFCFGNTLLLMDGAVGAAVAGGAGASTGAISHWSMLDGWEENNETGSWFFLDGSRWPILIKIYSSSACHQCAEDELQKK